MSQRLDPLTFPLRGSRLIEASAGTGKTFTLALLYTRLVLGHGPDGAAFERALMPPEILVVTFTDAATKELRDRIRARLVEAAAYFEVDLATAAGVVSEHAPEVGPNDGSERDPLWSLRADYAPEQWSACARRLRLAAEWMDEAMISTIHGWCYRMLKEHAFDTRGLFQRELVTDQTDLIAEIVRDYWRVHFYPLRPEQAACVFEVVQSPDKLQAELDAWLRRREAPLSYKGAPLASDQLQRALVAQCRWREQAREVEAQCRSLDEQNQALEDDARKLWQADRPAIEQALHQLRPHLSGTQHDSTTSEKFDVLLAACAAWSQGDRAPNKLKNFAQGAYRFKKTAKIQTETPHAAFQAIAAWLGAQSEKPRLPEAPEPAMEACLLAHAADWVGRELERRLLLRAEMGFDDLLRQLDAALAPVSVSAPEQAGTLADTIRRQFPVALIDEFQDTDPLQYRIFERIYASPAVADPVDAPAVGGAADDRTLILIGDPKQSIYGFRGADIHAYLAARAATSGRHYTLGTNYRGTTAVVAACNRLFSYAESHPRAAFRFQTEDDNPIPFLAVNAKGRLERLLLGGAEATAMTFWTLDSGPDPVAPGDYRAQMAASAASAIAGWLRQARAGQTGFQRDEGFEPLRPRNIAILVRTGIEAAVMREALTARRIASVYLSDRDSVLDTQEANDLLHWLRACASPTDEVLVRAALGSNTMAMPLDELERLQHDELGWEAQIERFRAYRQVWQRQGVLAMLRQLLHEAELPARLLARNDGERILTNLLHLAEWLQQSAAAIDGEQALIRHLWEHVSGQGTRPQGASGDEFIVRLESDAELVQIITIHKSKGLEYPLVLLPFICGWRAVDGNTRQVSYRQSDQRLIELAGKKAFPQAWDDADDARLSEDMRLLYVAVTRARHAVWLGIAALKTGTAKRPQLDRTAIGHVLNGGEQFDGPAQVWEALAQLRGDCGQMRIEPAPVPDLASGLEFGHMSPIGAPDDTLDDARPPPRMRPLPWWIASYSSLRLATVDAPAQTVEPSRLCLPDARSATMSADTPAQETALEEAARSASMDAEDAGTAQPRPRARKDKQLHALPRGSSQGTFLHGILEWAAVQRVQAKNGVLLRGFAAAAEAPTLRREMLGQRCNLRGLTAWIEPLNEWLSDFLTRRWTLHGLPDVRGRTPTLALRDLPPRQVQVELEFWLESRRVETAAVDALVQAHVLTGRPRPGLAAMQLNGMLKGFVDLVFEHDGRYYVVDWKSNWLGADDTAYTAAAMGEAILHARYDLQYVLYLLALHRQLAARLPDYDYDRHIGGALYVFLRGSYSDSQGLFMDKPPRVLIETLDRMFAGEQILV